MVVDGEVEVTGKGKRVAPRGGEFVREIALLEKTPRMAAVTAKTLRVFAPTRRDFRHLVDENPGDARPPVFASGELPAPCPCRGGRLRPLT